MSNNIVLNGGVPMNNPQLQFDTVGPFIDPQNTGMPIRMGGTVFSSGPQANQSAPAGNVVNLWSMNIPGGILNVVGKTLTVEAVGYLTSPGATGSAIKLQLLLGTIPLFSLQTSAIVKLSQTQCQFGLETWSTVVGVSSATTPQSNVESHGWISYVPTTAGVLQVETDANLVSGNLQPDLTQPNTLFITFQNAAAGTPNTNVQLKNVLVSISD